MLTLFSIALFLVPILLPKSKVSLLSEYFKPLVTILVVLGKGINDIVLSKTSIIVVVF